MDYAAFKVMETGMLDSTELDLFLSDFISGSNRRRKARENLKRIWVSKVNVDNLRIKALELLPELTERERILIHWGMLCYTYPFFLQTVRSIGRFFSTQKRVKTSQVNRRVKENFGDRRPVEVAVGEIMGTLKDWGIIIMESSGVYSQATVLRVDSSVLTNWILEIMLCSTNVLVRPYPAILREPELFPFVIKVNTLEVKKSDLFEIEKHGVDQMMITLKPELV